MSHSVFKKIVAITFKSLTATQRRSVAFKAFLQGLTHQQKKFRIKQSSHASPHVMIPLHGKSPHRGLTALVLWDSHVCGCAWGPVWSTRRRTHGHSMLHHCSSSALVMRKGHWSRAGWRKGDTRYGVPASMVSRESYGSLYGILCKVGTPKKTPLGGLSKNDFSPTRTRGEDSHLPVLFCSQ